MKKDWIARELTMEVVVGVFMITVFFGIAYFTIILSREALFSKRHELAIHFNHVMGLREGDSVAVRGMPIGKVQDLDLNSKGVTVIASLDEQVQLHEDYEISVVPSSILGGRYLEIDEGSPERPLLADGVAPEGRDPYDLVADAAELVNAIKVGVVQGGIVENLQAASKDLKTISSRLTSGKGTLGQLLSEDDTLYHDLSATVASLKTVAARIEQGQGVIGKLLTDESMADEVEKMVVEVRATIDDMREASPVVTFTSVFFGAF